MQKRRLNIDWLNHSLEFIVVIIGILIAFQLNKCSVDNQQRETVAIHMGQIKEEAEFNKWSIQQAIKKSESNIGKLDTILNLLNSQTDYEKVNDLTLELLNYSGAYLRKNAYQNLIESGDIRFIDEFETKKKIINLYEYYKWVESMDDLFRDVYIQDFLPLFKSKL